MPQHHNWFYHIPLGNPKRREKDRERKRTMLACGYEFIVPPLASYTRIDKHAFTIWRNGNHITTVYRLCDIARIYRLSSNTVYRWYRNGMLPPSFFYIRCKDGKIICLYPKAQVLVICKTLNDLFGQGIMQFRQSHYRHITMMKTGCEIAGHRLTYKAVAERDNRYNTI